MYYGLSPEKPKTLPKLMIFHLFEMPIEIINLGIL